MWLVKTSFNCTESVFTTRYLWRLEGKADWISAHFNLHLHGREIKPHLCDPKGGVSRVLGCCCVAIWLQTRPRHLAPVHYFRLEYCSALKHADRRRLTRNSARGRKLRLSKRPESKTFPKRCGTTVMSTQRLLALWLFSRFPDLTKISQKDFICACLALEVLQVLGNSKHSLLHTYDHRLKVQSPFKYVRVHSFHLELHSGV